MQNMMIIDFQKKEIKLVAPPQLFAHYRDAGLITMSELKSRTDFEDFIKNRRLCGDPIYLFEEYYKVAKISFKVEYGAKTFSYDTLDELIQFARDKRLSTASDAVIRRSILNNIAGKTKAAYKCQWRQVKELVDLDDFILNI